MARHDLASLCVLYERYLERIYAYIYRPAEKSRIQSPRVDRLASRTFYRALDKLDTYEDHGLPFSAWLPWFLAGHVAIFEPFAWCCKPIRWRCKGGIVGL